MKLQNNEGKMFLSLRMKFIILFFALITIPFCISGIITYHEYSSNVRERARNYTSQITGQVTKNIDRYVKDMERLTSSPFYNENVLEILRNHRSTRNSHPKYLNTKETNRMHLFISSLLFERPEIQGVIIMGNDGSIFSNLDRSVKTFWDLHKSKWLKAVKKQKGGLTIIPLHQANYYTANSLASHKVISFARLIREPYTGRALGIIKVDLTPDGFGEVISSLQFSDNGKLYITDSRGRLLYSSEGRIPGKISDELNELPNKDFLKGTSVSNYTDIKVTGVIPTSGIHKEAAQLTNFTIVISLFSLIAAYILATLASNRLVRPINHLQQKMNQIKKGSFKERAVVSTHDEIGQLTEVFNTMIDEIDQLVKEVYEVKLKEREAELSALQSQINPHFLYNTLESMNMIAMKNYDFELSDMITNLGNLFRYTVDKNEQTVFLKDEITFIESYLDIQSFRMGKLLKSEIDIDTAYEDILVPKLILQPLVENVIEHGLGNKTVTIRIKIEVAEEDVHLIVEDDGKGIPDTKINKIKRRLYAEEHLETNLSLVGKNRFGHKKRGFALRNIHQRIQLLFGSPYGLYIDHSMEQVTRILIHLPLQLEEE